MTAWQQLIGYREVDLVLWDGLYNEANARISEERLRLERDSGERLSFDADAHLGRKVINDVLTAWRSAAYDVGRAPLGAAEEEALALVVHDRMYGLGPIEPFVNHAEVTDIHLSGASKTWLTLRDGTKIPGPPAADDDEELIRKLSELARRVGWSEQQWDRKNISLDLWYKGARLHALREVTGHPVVDIRNHSWDVAHLDQLISDDEVDVAIAEFLRAAVRARFNIVISGEVWAGKTTLLRCLINEIPPLERIITIEDSRELGIEHFPEEMHADVEAIEARKANIEDKAEYTLGQAVRDSLRMGSGPDGRVMVGEVRGYEVLPMLKVMSQGKDGSMCTVHARSSRDALDRLQTYALEATPPYPLVASARLIGNGVHFVVHLKWHTDDRQRSKRRVQSILEVSHGEGEQVMANEVWAPDSAGRGIPAAPLRHDTELRLAQHGFDPGLRDKPEGWWRS